MQRKSHRVDTRAIKSCMFTEVIQFLATSLCDFFGLSRRLRKDGYTCNFHRALVILKNLVACASKKSLVYPRLKTTFSFGLAMRKETSKACKLWVYDKRMSRLAGTQFKGTDWTRYWIESIYQYQYPTFLLKLAIVFLGDASRYYKTVKDRHGHGTD